MMDYAGKIDLPDYKLSTVCAHYGIDIKAHEALSDIQATRELTLKLIGEVMS
jgi:DNA polymerase III epsilon subunit-like protein